MVIIAAAFLCGLVFGWGLQISAMTDPNKIFGFLDVFGAWDPSLALVMAGALAVTAPAYFFAQSRQRAVLAAEFRWPRATVIDAPLLAGSALFGLGWGLIGLCPGPSIVNLATLSPAVIAFVAAMGAGMLVHDLVRSGTGIRSEEAATSG